MSIGLVSLDVFVAIFDSCNTENDEKRENDEPGRDGAEL